MTPRVGQKRIYSIDKRSLLMKHDKLTFKGLKHTREWREMMSQKLKNRKFSQETLCKMSVATKKRNLVGSKNPNWRGGISLDNFRGRFDAKGSALKRLIKRNSNKCGMCNKEFGNICPHCEQKIKSYAHHIKSWKDYPELRYDPQNGILLCEKCHKLVENLANLVKARTVNTELNSLNPTGINDKCVETIYETPSNGMKI